MLKIIKRLIKEDDGQGMVEYGLILALIAIVVIAALSPLGTKIAQVFTNIKSELTKTIADPDSSK